MSYGILGGLGRVCYRHRWITLLAWIGGLACLVALWVNFGAAADNNFGTADPGQTLLNQHFPRQSGDTLTLAIRSSGPVTAPATQARVRNAIAPFRAAPHVTGVSALNFSRNGHIAFATVQFDEQSSDIPTGEVSSLMAGATAASGHGVTFSLGGDVVDTIDTPYGGPSDGFGVAASMIVLVVAFGSLLAMGLPIACALFGIGSGLSLTSLIGHVFPAPAFSPIIASMIGLGVGVDYALFVVTRFRAELRDALADGLTPRERRAVAETAAVTAMRTAGRAVLTAGATVVIGLLGLLVLRQQLLTGTAIAASATVTMTVLAALTLLPALLGFSGTRLVKPSRFRLPRRAVRGAADGSAPGRSGITHPAERWAAVIQRRPVTAAVTSTVVVLALAAPTLAMKLSMPDDSAQPRTSMGYASYATMAQGFGPGFDAPLIVAASPAASADKIVTALRSVHGIARVTAPVISADHAAAMIIAYPTTGEQDPATNALVNTISSVTLPRVTAGTGTHAYLTGPNAGNVAFANLIGQRLPWLIAIVVALSMLLILTMFRSVVIAVKAALMNLLSITAAYGVLTAVTQWGWGGKLFGFPEPMPVTTWVPVFLFVILFGLSMDYEVFLLSRVREVWLASGSNSLAVARGLGVTARVISAAAAIMVLVFVGFVATPEVSVKQIGLGLAVAVLIDATIVRLVLVPALMELLGRANWWLPSWLARALPGSQDSPREDEPVTAGAVGAAGG